MTAAAPTRDQWLEERRQYIGATDLSAMLGLNPYSTPLAVYCDKLGIVPPQAETAAMRRGLRLEPYIAQLYADETGRSVWKWPEVKRHPSKSYLAVNPDYAHGLRGVEEGRLVECKSHLPWLAHYYGEPGSDQIPQWEQVQCQWQAHLTGVIDVDLVVLLGLSEDDLRIYTVQYDPEIGGILEQEADRFWQDHILAEVPPEVTGREADSELLKRLYPNERDTVVIADAATNQAAIALRAAKREAAVLDDVVTLYENRLKEFMGDAAILETSEGKFTWKAPKSGAISWKSIAERFKPSPALIAEFTGEPSRRFNTPFKKGS